MKWPLSPGNHLYVSLVQKNVYVTGRAQVLEVLENPWNWKIPFPGPESPGFWSLKTLEYWNFHRVQLYNSEFTAVEFGAGQTSLLIAFRDTVITPSQTRSNRQCNMKACAHPQRRFFFYLACFGFGWREATSWWQQWGYRISSSEKEVARMWLWCRLY